MNGLPYYKAYPRDFIEGTVGMSFELKGAYRLVLDLIYMQGGELPDDARYISGLLGCTIRKWTALRGDLVARGKLTANGEFLTNDRVAMEIETLGKLRDKQRENRSRPNKNKHLATPQRNHTEPESEPKTDNNQRSIITPREDDAALPEVSDLKILSDRLMKVAAPCLASPAVAPGLVVMTVPMMWLDQGADLERDVIPAIQGVVAKGKRNISTWDYFTKPVAENKARSLKGLPHVDMPAAKPYTGKLKSDGNHETQGDRMRRLLAEYGHEGALS